MTSLSLVPEIAAYKGINFKTLINWMIKDASKKGKKNKFFYILLIIFLTSTNNYNFKSNNLFSVKKIIVKGLTSDKKHNHKTKLKVYFRKEYFFKQELFYKFIRQK